MRTGTADRMMRVSRQERLKARTTHVRKIPEARDEAFQISSVSLLKERMDQLPKKWHARDGRR